MGGVKDYMNMKRFQDSQTFSRINREGVQESLNNLGIYNNKDEPEPYEYKAIDSQIGSLMKRDYTVDRSHMRNQNMASLVVSSGKHDSTISPAPRIPRLNDSLMFKSTVSPQNMVQSIIMNNHNTITSGEPPKRNIVSPSRDSRNIKLEPISPNSIKNKKHKSKLIEMSSPVDPKLEETKNASILNDKLGKDETATTGNLLEKSNLKEKRESFNTNADTEINKTSKISTRKPSEEKR